MANRENGRPAVFCGHCGVDVTDRMQYRVRIETWADKGRWIASRGERVLCWNCYPHNILEQTADLPTTWTGYLAAAPQAPEYLIGIEKGPGGWIAYRVPNDGAWPYRDMRPPRVATPVCASPQAAYDQLVEAVASYRRAEEELQKAKKEREERE